MKKRSRWLIAGFVFLCLLMFFVLMQVPPGTFSGKRLMIGKETTFLTEPLRADGGVDYAAALNQRRSKGVTPENNAVVELLRVFGDDRYDFPEDSAFTEQFAKALGIDSIPFERELIDAGFYVTEKRKAALENGFDADGSLQLQMDTEHDLVLRPWKAADLPDWAEALEKQQAALDIVVAASKRSHYYHPIVLITDGSGKQGLLIGSLLPVAQSTRHAARQLHFRAMNSIAEDRMESAIEDIQSMRRLAWLTGQSSTLVEELVSIGEFGMTFDAEEKLLRSGKLSRQQLADYQVFLKQHPFPANLDERINYAERFFMLDYLTHASLYGSSTDHDFLFGSGGDGAAKYIPATADLSETMRVANQWMDRQLEVLQKPTMKERVAASRDLEAELEELDARVSSPVNGIRSLIAGPKSRGRLFGEFLVCMMVPAISQVLQAENRTAIHDSLMPVAFALELFRLDNGKYPDSLSELSPDYLETVPTDELNQVPYTYKKTGTGFLLYSIGVDGVDQGGRSAEESKSYIASDIRICVGDPPEPHPDSAIVSERYVAEAERKSIEEEKARKKKRDDEPKKSDDGK